MNDWTLHFIVQVGGILSLLGALFVIISFACFRQLLRDSQVRCVLWLAVADAFLGLAYAFGDASKLGHIACLVQAGFVTFFQIASILWTCNIATGILVNIVQPSRKASCFFEFYYHGFGWGIPAIVTTIFGARQILGRESDLGGWCWILEDVFTETHKGIWQIAGLFIFLWCSCLYILILFVVIGCYVRIKNRSLRSKIDQMTFEAIRKQNRTVVFKFFLYPVVLLVAYFFATINEFYSMFSGTDVAALLILHSIFAHTLGLTNCLVYGFSQNIFGKYLTWCRDCCSRCRMNPSAVSLDDDDEEFLDRLDMVEIEDVGGSDMMSSEDSSSQDIGL